MQGKDVELPLNETKKCVSLLEKVVALLKPLQRKLFSITPLVSCPDSVRSVDTDIVKKEELKLIKIKRFLRNVFFPLKY